MNIDITDRIAAFTSRVRSAALAGVAAAAEVVTAEAQGLVIEQGPPKKGEPPRLRTGRGFQSIQSEAVETSTGPEARAGSQLGQGFPYMARHERAEGMGQHPWLMPAFDNTRDAQAAAAADAAETAMKQ